MEAGEKYGRLTAVKFSHKSLRGINYWDFRCECGKSHRAASHNVSYGATKSCGCYRREKLIERTPFKKGKDHPSFIDCTCDMRSSKFYRTFRGVIQSCNNRNSTVFEYYGGRGIKCEWKSYKDFKKDMYDSFLKHEEEHGSHQTSLDRINVNGNYSKENCRWATMKEQQNNRRNTIFIEYKGSKIKSSELREKVGNLIVDRVNAGWEVEDAESTKFHLRKPIKLNEMSKGEKNFREEKKKIMELFKRSAKIVGTYLSVLTERERSIIEKRFGLKTGKRMTLESIGKEEGCTRENIRLIEARAIKKMITFYSELSY